MEYCIRRVNLVLFIIALGLLFWASKTQAEEKRAFLYSNGLMSDLNNLIDPGSGWTLTGAYGINDSGQIVGSGLINDQQHAFVMSPSTDYYNIADLGTLGGTSSWANRINNNGQIIGISSFAGDTPLRAFLYSNGVMTDLGTLGGTSSFAYDINNTGHVVGSAAVALGVTHAFLYSDGTMTDLGVLGGAENFSEAYAINDNGQIVGFSSAGSQYEFYQHAFLYSNGIMSDLGTLGGQYSWARGINNSGQVVGESYTVGNVYQHAFLYSDGVMTDLGVLAQYRSSSAKDINDIGQVVGFATTAANATHAFLYSNGVMSDLGTLEGMASSWATDINNNGQVVGISYAPTIVPNPTVPIPTAFWLFGSGLLGLIGMARRKK